MANGKVGNDSATPNPSTAIPPVDRFPRIAVVTVLVLALLTFGYFVWGAVVRSSAEDTLKKAANAMLKGDPASAREQLTWLQWFDPQNPRALHLVGMSFLKENNVPAAQQILEQIREDSGVYENAQTLLASGLLADQQYDKADMVLRRILKRNPKNAVACRQLSGLWLTELRSREAVQVLDDFLRQSLAGPIVLSDFLFLLRDLGSTEFHAPLPQDCVATLHSAFKRHPDQFRVQLALADCYVRLGNWDEAGRMLQAAQQVGSQEFDYRATNCEFWLGKGEVDRADAALLGSANAAGTTDGASKELESHDRYWELRCRIAELRGADEQALSDVNLALSLRPNCKEYESRRARLLQKLQRPDEARPAFERTHQLAKSELELWRLTRDFGVKTPTLAECEQVAQLYESLGRKLPGEAWRRLGELLAQDAPLK